MAPYYCDINLSSSCSQTRSVYNLSGLRWMDCGYASMFVTNSPGVFTIKILAEIARPRRRRELDHKVIFCWYESKRKKTLSLTSLRMKLMKRLRVVPLFLCTLTMKWIRVILAEGLRNRLPTFRSSCTKAAASRGRALYNSQSSLVVIIALKGVSKKRRGAINPRIGRDQKSLWITKP